MAQKFLPIKMNTWRESQLLPPDKTSACFSGNNKAQIKTGL